MAHPLPFSVEERLAAIESRTPGKPLEVLPDTQIKLALVNEVRALNDEQGAVAPAPAPVTIPSSYAIFSFDDADASFFQQRFSAVFAGIDWGFLTGVAGSNGPRPGSIYVHFADLSSYQATWGFIPGAISLNAEIQINQDARGNASYVDYTIKHEVAHEIDFLGGLSDLQRQQIQALAGSPYWWGATYTQEAAEEWAASGFYQTYGSLPPLINPANYYAHDFSTSQLPTIRSIVPIGTGPISDLQPPSAPINFQARAISSNQVALNWTEASDNIAVSGYTLTRNGTQVAAFPASVFAWTDTGLTPGTDFRYTLTAYDAAGNVGPASVVLAHTPAPTQLMAVFRTKDRKSGNLGVFYHANGTTRWDLNDDCTIIKQARKNGKTVANGFLILYPDQNAAVAAGAQHGCPYCVTPSPG